VDLNSSANPWLTFHAEDAVPLEDSPGNAKHAICDELRLSVLDGPGIGG